MSQNRIKKIIAAGLMAALCCVATMFVRIPSLLHGYVHLGDCVVLLSGWLLGPIWGSAAGGFGSALADFISGYPHYVPATLMIKAACAFLCSLSGSNGTVPRRLTFSVLAELVMIAGYFGYSSLFLGNGWAAATSVPGNMMQASVGVISFLLLSALLRKNGLDKRL